MDQFGWHRKQGSCGHIHKNYQEYLEKECSNIIVGGRLGNYKYYDMDMTIGNALTTVKKELAGK